LYVILDVMLENYKTAKIANYEQIEKVQNNISINIDRNIT